MCVRVGELPLAFQGKQEENDVVEKLSLFLDLLQSYKVSLGCSLVGGRTFRNDLRILQGSNSWGTEEELRSQGCRGRRGLPSRGGASLGRLRRALAQASRQRANASPGPAGPVRAA